ncbi:phospholipase D-like domain-containing protein [Ralstonia sp. OTU4908]|jgi:phosphatidylserine/phosphatidylglycerophosphate/cardiolipin synthase-like enzyme|uniref:phospholipase D-like domain-containing protein n=1 Tax=Ralstonia sp. OTU4908 TaxID=3043851 RepID=UPI00313B2194
MSIARIAVSLVLALGAGTASAEGAMRGAITDVLRGAVSPVPQGQQVEVGFSPEGSAVALVLKAIGSARKSIHVMAYVMSSPEIASALARAARSGVEVYVQLDYKENIEEDKRGFIRNRLDELSHSGAVLCTISAFPAMHEKTMVIDARHVEVGSFNYSSQAARRNSETALVLWNAPAVAQQYEAHFRERISYCTAYRAGL